LRAILPADEEIARMELRDAVASVRDLGMLCASLRRHGVEPVEALPPLERALLLLGEKTGMVPRDTVFHYGPWNPPSARERRFTLAPDEAALIECTRIAAPRLEEAAGVLARLRDVPLGAPELVDGCHHALAKLEHLVAAIHLARERVGAVFFAQELRPYFESIRIGGRRYAGAAAAPLSVGILDHLLWSSDCHDPEYRSFQDHTMVYNTPRMRGLYAACLGERSLVTRLVSATGRQRSASLLAGTEAVDALLTKLLAFRGPHIAVARAAYSSEVRRYPVGSAGYGVDTLQLILRLTTEARRSVRGAAMQPAAARREPGEPGR
jgi:monodechloroaminopyrrolnitrin synthase